VRIAESVASGWLAPRDVPAALASVVGHRRSRKTHEQISALIAFVEVRRDL